ncbi:hypothetical protein LTR95_011758 [Oleoguttula sp. CCFEE 5521]
MSLQELNGSDDEVMHKKRQLSSDDEVMPTKRRAKGVTAAISTLFLTPSPPPLIAARKRKATTAGAVELSVDGATNTALVTPPKSARRKTANATATETPKSQTPTKVFPAAQSTAADAVTTVPKSATKLHHRKISARTTDKIKHENNDTDPVKIDDTPVKIEDEAHKLQELCETIAKLGKTVHEQANTIAKLTAANLKSAESEAKLVDSNSKLVKRNADLLGMPSVIEGVERERSLVKREAEFESNKKAAAEKFEGLGKSIWRREQAVRYEEVVLQTRWPKLDKATSVTRELTQPKVYDAQSLDIYKTDRVSNLPADDPLAKQLVRLWERKVAAVLGNKPLSKHVKIPEDVLYSSWRNHAIVHCFEELDKMWQYLDDVAEICKHLVHGKYPILLFADQMRDCPVGDAEVWLQRADNVLEKLTQTFETGEVEERLGHNCYSASSLRNRRQRRFRALKRGKVLSALGAKKDSVKKYRMAKLEAETFAIQEDFDGML